MSDSKLYPVSKQWAESAWADDATYQAMYNESVENPISSGRASSQHH